MTDLRPVKFEGVFSVLLLFDVSTACDKTDHFLLKTLSSHGIQDATCFCFSFHLITAASQWLSWFLLFLTFKR